MLKNEPFETKAAGGDAAQAYDEFMRVLESFRETNDERLAQIERKLGPDPVTTDKLARLDRAVEEHKRAVDELTLKVARPALDGGPGAAPAGREHKAAFEGYVRRGAAERLRDIEAKSLSVGTGSDGGYLVPAETERTINHAVRALSPIRAIAGVRQVSSATYKKPFAVTGPETGWVGEKTARPETDSPTLAELSFPTMELYAMPAATQMLLDDSAVDIDQWIAEEVREAFAVQEGTAFVTGAGTSTPKGFLAYTAVANASWSWGNLGFLATGVDGAFPSSNPADKLIDLAYTLKAGYRANATFVMNRATLAAVRKMKDADGHYLWQPSATPGEASTILGFPVAESEDMPAIATGSLSIALGDFRRGYLIVDRLGIRVLRDPYSAKPYVLFYTTKRVGGGVQDFDAIKLLKFAA